MQDLMNLCNTPIGGKFDLNHMKEIHRKLFGYIYEWVGQTRLVDIAKGNSMFLVIIRLKVMHRRLRNSLQKNSICVVLTLMNLAKWMDITWAS
ncbi:fido (protein-threonine AMPylation protein) [Bartonella heixiaziensis]